MKPSQRLELRTGQSLILTPQLQQSLKILQLSSLDLNSYIAEELEKNPLLISEDEEKTEAQEASDEKPENIDRPENLFEARGQEPEIDMQNVWSEEQNSKAGEKDFYNFSGNAAGQKGFYENGYDIFESSLSKEQTIREHILEQINLDLIGPPQRIIALHLLDMLDDAGYISADFTPLAASLSCAVSQIEEVLQDLQKCDPAGIFARSLSECLELQLKDKDRFDPAMKLLLANLDLLAKNDLAKLKKTCDVSGEDLSEMIAELKALNPKPASNFSNEMVQAVQADVFVRKNNNIWHIELNSDLLPKLLVNKKYYSEISLKTNDVAQKKYLSDRLSTANWLIKTLNNRAETILKVVTELVTKQHEFFERGIMHLKPMTMREIAEKIGMHESTVSRVVSNKFVQTSFGLYELKYFFTSSISNSSITEDQGNFSSQTVKHLIKQLIDSEGINICSDDKLAELLHAKGIDVARRTIAKYREELKIPTSSIRKRKIYLQASA